MSDQLFDFSRLSADELQALAAAMGIGGLGLAPGAGPESLSNNRPAETTTNPTASGSSSTTAAGPSTAPTTAPSGQSSAAGPSTPHLSTTSSSSPSSSTSAAPAAVAQPLPPNPISLSSRPDLVRLADVITHASLVLAHPAPNGSGTDTGGKKKYTRSRRGCLTCRARKVKCDEVRPTCLRCAGMGRACTWDQQDERNKRKHPDGDDDAPLNLPPTVSAALAEITALAPALQAAQNGGGLPLPQPALQALAQLIPAAQAQQQQQPQQQQPQQQRAGSSSDRATAPAPKAKKTQQQQAATSSSTTAVASSSSAGGAAHFPTSAPVPGLPVSSYLYPWTLDLGAGVGGSGSGGASSSAAPKSKRQRADTGSSGGTDAWPATTAAPVPVPTAPPTMGQSDGASSSTSPGAGVAYGTPSWDEFMRSSPFGWAASASAMPTSAAPPVKEESERKNSDGSDVIELARAMADRKGNIVLADSTVEDLDTVRDPPDVNLALRGQIARRRQPPVSQQSQSQSTAMGLRAHSQAQDLGGAFSGLNFGNDPPPIEVIAPGPQRTLDPFAHVFPSSATRGLFQHYVDSTSGIVTAMGRGQPGKNPFLQVSLPLVLADTATPALTALRFALLTTSAAHILHLRGGTDPEAQALCDKLKRLAIGYTVLSENADADLVLATCVIILTRDVLNADRSWRHNLDYALAAVRRRGGPKALMQRDPSFMKRFVLEQMAVHEVFSCFTTGNEPSLLTPGAEWWFDVEASARTAWEWESIEHQFGISRAMVEMIARVCTLNSRRHRLGPGANLDDPDLAPVAAYLRDEAETLLADLETFGINLRSLPYRRRVQFGDHIYRLTMSLHLMADILGLPASHPRVRAVVPAALELCSEVSMQPVMLVWPLLFMARVAEVSEREWLRGLLSTYADQYCRDLQVATELIYDVWARLDRGEAFPGWSVVMAETGRDVLFI